MVDNSRPLSEFRFVDYQYHDASYVNRELVHESEVDAFCEGLLRLHYDPGVNPVTKEKTTEIRRIEVKRVEPGREPYWWCGPSLDGSDGATLYSNGTIVKRWLNPRHVGHDFEGTGFKGGWY